MPTVEWPRDWAVVEQRNNPGIFDNHSFLGEGSDGIWCQPFTSTLDFELDEFPQPMAAQVTILLDIYHKLLLTLYFYYLFIGFTFLIS